MKNEHKQKQLKELALINGTLRDDDYRTKVLEADAEAAKRSYKTMSYDQVSGGAINVVSGGAINVVW
jgi:hypothetical protein